ncbi:hypothetical protein ACFCYN_04600 [Gottfriedia sp. NPDC056225]|uniref:hypothetical protein n=1 Tax=Gottfriedia sp. NPDC056225 TaxID=3345751 RepID=UPI0035D53FD8
MKDSQKFIGLDVSIDIIYVSIAVEGCGVTGLTIGAVSLLYHQIVRLDVDE